MMYNLYTFTPYIMTIKNGLLVWTAFVLGMAVMGSSFAQNHTDTNTAKEAVKNAILSQDYDLFVASASERMLEKIDSQSAFDELVAHKQAMEALKTQTQSQVLTAVQNNDFVAFQSIKEEMKAKKQELHDARDADNTRSERVRPEPTAEQLAERAVKQQERFDAMVEYYNTNGELPELTRKGKGGMKKGMRGGKRGWSTNGEVRGDRGQTL